jgi:hypothetical protein
MKIEELSPGLLQFISDMFDNLNKVSEMNRAVMWNVGLVNTGDGSRLGDFVNVWAGIGEANPIKRIEQLLLQREVLKQFITKVSESHAFSEDEKANMNILFQATN